jgi:hypothetical protein
VCVKRAGKEHLTVEAHAIQVAYPRRNIREAYTTGGTDLAARVRAELGHDEARGIRLLRARTEGMRFEPAFDEPTGAIITQTGCVGDLDGARAPDGVFLGQCFPHGRAERAMGVGIEYLITLQHQISPLWQEFK